MDEIKRVALLVREKFEQDLIDKSILEKIYGVYHSIDNVPLFIKRAQKLFPKMNCGLASVYLQKLIPGSKIIRGKYKNILHTFLLLNEVVIDITADQYGGPRVYVGPLKKPWSLREPTSISNEGLD